MATKIYVENNFLIAKNVVSRNIYIKIGSVDAFHLRDSADNFSFFSNVAYQGANGVSFIQLGAMQDWSFLAPPVPIVRTGATVYPFSEIVDKDGLAYASADDLEDYLNENLGVISVISPDYLTEVAHDGTLTGLGTDASPLSVVSSASGYFKAEVLITSGSISASSLSVPVPGLTYTIPSLKGGDYVFYAVISVDIDNSDMKPLAIMLFKNGVKETNSVTVDFAKKNENQSVQLTYALDGLVATDVIAVYVNNDNEDINNIVVGRILAQKFV
jgi:hypothetical protein